VPSPPLFLPSLSRGSFLTSGKKCKKASWVSPSRIVTTVCRVPLVVLRLLHFHLTFVFVPGYFSLLRATTSTRSLSSEELLLSFEHIYYRYHHHVSWLPFELTYPLHVSHRTRRTAIFFCFFVSPVLAHAICVVACAFIFVEGNSTFSEQPLLPPPPAETHFSSFVV
jgi:hypothetical protein